MTATRLEIEQEIVRILSQSDPEASMVPVPLTGTISAVGSITSPGLDRGSIDSSRFNGRLIKVIEDATALAYSTPVTVTGAHSATTTTLTVSATGLIATGDILELGTTLEKVLVRAVPSSTTLTVTRGYQGTTATALTGGETVRYDPFGFVTGVDDAGLASGGVLTISPNFTVAGYAAGSFLMYPKGLLPDYVIAKLNSVLRSTDAPHIWAPSLVPDSDFASNDLTNWPAVATPTTRSFITTPTQLPIFGERVLSIVTDAANEGAESTSIPVDEGESLILAADVSVTAFSSLGLTVIIRDVTGATDEVIASGITNTLWTRVLRDFSPPTGSKNIRIRFISADAAVSFYVAPHIIVQSHNRRSYPVPSWWTRESQLKDLVRLIPSQSAQDSGEEVARSSYESVDIYRSFIRSDSGLAPTHISFQGTGYPIYALVQRPFSELAYDTASTPADKDYVAFKTISNIYRDRSDDKWKHWAGRAAERAKTLGYGGRELKSSRPLVHV